MSQRAAPNLISTEIRAAQAAWSAMIKERIEEFGRQGMLAIWAIRPIFDLAIAALIYAGGAKDLVPYIVVSMTANSLVWNSIFWVGEILDRERRKGTLLSLFLAPCSRLSWLIGFAGSGIFETAAAAFTVAIAGMLLFGVRFHPNYLTLLVTLPLFVASLIGIGLILSGFGLITKHSNELSNVVFPIFTILGGAYYPVNRLPEIPRVLAHLLPLGYGFQALSAAALNGASIYDVRASLIPLLGFAIALPLAGTLIFRLLERSVRRSGELELY
ncbi:MAG TPA: ABC transporter permease [Nitrolancea sp.]|nr:ABC transporter permease [Nitrolancea sp.]